MKKATATLALLLACFVGLAGAGEPDAKNPVEVVPTDPEMFVPGFELKGFVAGAMPSTGESALGGGVNLAYYFTKNVGINASYAVFEFDDALHVVSADLALRYPIAQSGLAPYLIMGGGLQSDGTTEGLYRLGGGLDLDLGAMGIFADGIYNWAEGDTDFTVARFGVRIPF